MSTPLEERTREARLLSPARFEGLIKAYYPFWDAQYRPYLLEAVRRLPAEHFEYKPRPEMLTARQVILHIAEAERWWIHHVVDGEPYEDFTAPHEDAAQGYVDLYEAVDHNALLFPLEEYHRHTQRWFGFPAKELDRVIVFRGQGGAEHRFTLHWILDHVQEHELHHRAQLNLYLRLLGITPPSI
jgi:uncharacterized damage-inducible protein DinB